MSDERVGYMYYYACAYLSRWCHRNWWGRWHWWMWWIGTYFHANWFL